MSGTRLQRQESLEEFDELSRWMSLKRQVDLTSGQFDGGTSWVTAEHLESLAANQVWKISEIPKLVRGMINQQSYSERLFGLGDASPSPTQSGDGCLAFDPSGRRVCRGRGSTGVSTLTSIM